MQHKPYVDVIVPVHSASRPIERAVDSVTAQAGRDVRVTVVCHGISTEDVERRVRHPNVRVILHEDGAQSAAGPMNAGIARSDAEYVCRLDSDDWFEEGALSQWIMHARATAADVVIAPLRWGASKPLFAPLTRPFRHSRLDAVRDRLAYRTAPFGLIRRARLAAIGAQYTDGLAVGEDLEIGLKLWFQAGRVDLAVAAPCYVVGDDAGDRVTEIVRPIEDELAAVLRATKLDWITGLGPAQRRAIAIKLARIHVIGALSRRVELDRWREGDVEWLQELMRSFRHIAPGFLRPFSRADAALLRAARESADPAELTNAIAAHASAAAADKVFASRLLANCDRESTLRRYARYRLPR